MDQVTNINFETSVIIIDELLRLGITEFVVCTGSRSTPLLLALSTFKDLVIYTHIDERSAGFFALGIAKRTGLPGVVVSTSGTAVANLFPALIEASIGKNPLILISADRPSKLMHTGSNQTIDQINIFGDKVRNFQNIMGENLDHGRNRYLRTMVDRLFHSAVSSGYQGPVHLNIQFDKPLEPSIETTLDALTSNILGRFSGRGESRPWMKMYEPEKLNIDPNTHNYFKGKSKILISCGPQKYNRETIDAIKEFSEVADAPIFADPLSGLRYAGKKNRLTISSYETFLVNHPSDNLFDPPDLIIHIGRLPVGKQHLRLLAMYPNVTRINLNETNSFEDEFDTSEAYFYGKISQIMKKFTDQLSSDQKSQSVWSQSIVNLSENTEKYIDSSLLKIQNSQNSLFEGLIVKSVFDHLPEETTIFLSNSLPIRHADQFIHRTEKYLNVLGNRGVSGIDGIISTSSGLAGKNKVVYLIIGDLAFLHDLNALHLIRKYGITLKIILLNNYGGGIFERLPISNFKAEFKELFLAKHELNFENIAVQFDFDYYAPTTYVEFSKNLRRSIESDEPCIIEIKTTSEFTNQTTQRIIQDYNL
ncbi:MAG: 2-succinyl-5-enolpyruvyl-6-hydroxy-3-cyclohexene-1-carboxylic-acid synthase [Candidatus Heimdallarchaeota archaeon]|nr:2-succinyl-5-enolpyruvyl-6-hydroxy-3-cyclohexene-1-carboxylic-acid synthase [Candidatus Heimdallarchaeota archaeon]